MKIASTYWENTSDSITVPGAENENPLQAEPDRLRRTSLAISKIIKYK